LGKKEIAERLEEIENIQDKNSTSKVKNMLAEKTGLLELVNEKLKAVE
jgi:hypothetical protein